MQIVLFDNDSWRIKLYPLTLTRPVSNLRVGILTIDEKWSRYFNVPMSFITKDYLSTKFPLSIASEHLVIIKGNILPDIALCEKLNDLKIGDAHYTIEGEVIAIKTERGEIDDVSLFNFDVFDERNYRAIFYPAKINQINYPED